MAELARFAESPGGRLYALSCERYGIDPAAGITSDWLEAANLRAALMVASMPREEQPEPEPGEPSGFLADDAHLAIPKVSHG